MSISLCNCVVCDAETGTKHYNEYYEQWDAVCFECESEYFRATAFVPRQV